jgi:hypothetical protein
MTSPKILLASASLVALGCTGALAAEAGVPAVEKIDGVPSANQLASGLIEAPVAVGMMKIENGSGAFPYYGFAGDGDMMPAYAAVQGKDMHIEATKTEPDKNTYLVMSGATGPTAGYDYGTHFLFQGHEVGPEDADGHALGVITRINLDADAAHRITLMAEKDIDGAPVPVIDGSVWDPFAKQLLFSAELSSPDGGIWQGTADFPSKVVRLPGFGSAGYEGIQIDKNGSIWIVEDDDDKKGKDNPHSKQPNSFVYRFVPKDKTDLTKGGKLEALQIMTSDGQPVTFHADAIDADITSEGMKQLHTYATSLKTAWVVIHDTDADGMEPFSANELAKAKGATPLKRPENGQFRPGSDFKEFAFAETGDTNASTEVGAAYGGFGAILKISQASADADEGAISLVYLCDEAHTGLDNVSFWSADNLVAVEDAGDGLHGQRHAYDSAYVIDLTADYSRPDTQPTRIIAIGRDPLSTIDTMIGAAKAEGFQNEGDNEITGIHISDGDATEAGLIGTKVPTPFQAGWRVFYTQQHGENTTWEVLSPASSATN